MTLKAKEMMMKQQINYIIFLSLIIILSGCKVTQSYNKQDLKVKEDLFRDISTTDTSTNFNQ